MSGGRSKAQVWSLDLIMSILIFIVSVELIFFAFNQSSSQLLEQTELVSLEDVGLEVTDTLIRTEGFPHGWDVNTVQVIGLAEKENVLNTSKVQFFLALNYNTTKKLLGIANYDFLLTINHLNNSIIRIGGSGISYGSPSSANATVVPVERYVIYAGIPAKLRFVLYTIH